MRGKREHCLDCGAVLDKTSLARHRPKCPKPGGRKAFLEQRLKDIDAKLDEAIRIVKTFCRERVKVEDELGEILQKERA